MIATNTLRRILLAAVTPVLLGSAVAALSPAFETPSVMGGKESDSCGVGAAGLITFFSIGDASLDEGLGDSAFGHLERLVVGGWSPSSGHVYAARSVVRFEFSGFHPGAEVNQALLRLYVADAAASGATYNEITVYRVVEDWDEYSVT